MSFYSEMAETVHELLLPEDQGGFGQAGTLRVATGAYSTTTRKVTNTDTDYAVTVAVFDYDFRTAGMATQNGTLIQAGDKQVLMAALGLTVVPKPDDRVIVGADTWTIKSVKAINPAGTVVLYDLMARK